VDQDNKENRLDIPVGVENQVRYAQLIAIVITVISQDEVRQSLNVLYTGYDQDIVSRAFHHPSDASVSASHQFGCSMGFRWYLSLILRLVAGIFGLAVTFMLLITVDSVRELLLNFTAVEFVSNVDDAVFFLFKWGYFGDPLKPGADTIVNAKCPVKSIDEDLLIENTSSPTSDLPSEQAKPFVVGENEADVKCCPCRNFPVHSVCLAFIFIGMFAAWLALSLKQKRGEYLSKTI
jgi:hypothetical protein